MSFMMSKQGYLSDADGHWHPHLMFFVAHTDAAAWGANLRGSPIIAAQSDPATAAGLRPLLAVRSQTSSATSTCVGEG